MEIIQLLQETVTLQGSDLHLSVGLRPFVRHYGDLIPLEYPVLSSADMERFIVSIVPERLISRFKAEGQADFAYEKTGLGRFRGNVYRQNRGVSLALRLIPSKILPLESFNFPENFIRQCMKRSGLILVTGPTGSGKSTTLASILDHLNMTKKNHIITIEDPIEFIHQSKSCLVHQRQIGEHTVSFASALRAALREDPDIILVGEMRDLETIELALTAAETGHLVLGTLHTRSAAKTLDRMISAFPANQQNQIRTMAAESIRAIVSQALLPRLDRPGMVVSFEILIMTPGIQNLVREMKIYQIPSAIQTGSRFGMWSMEQSLKKMLLEKIISQEIAQELLPTTTGSEVPEPPATTTHKAGTPPPSTKPPDHSPPPPQRSFLRRA